MGGDLLLAGLAALFVLLASWGYADYEAKRRPPDPPPASVQTVELHVEEP